MLVCAEHSTRQSQPTPPTPAVWIGTSGWVYKHWQGLFYPSTLPAAQHLPFYATHFPTVEVNFSFYRLPERSVFEAWRRQTPEGFLFAVKGSRYLTHMKKLKEPHEPLSRLIHRVHGLGEKLGPVLWQFPRTWPVHLERLQPFLDLLREYPGQRFACEFRHHSWLHPQVYARLAHAGAALCLPVGPGIPLESRLTAPWTCLRFHHGRQSIGYGAKELHTWATAIQKFLDQGADVYAYFNNDSAGHAIRDAHRLRHVLGRE